MCSDIFQFEHEMSIYEKGNAEMVKEEERKVREDGERPHS